MQRFISALNITAPKNIAIMIIVRFLLFIFYLFVRAQIPMAQISRSAFLRSVSMSASFTIT